MLISKQHLLTLHTAGKDDSRPMLTQIKVFKEGKEVVAVSTDSYILSEVREETPDDADFPLAPEDMQGSVIADEYYLTTGNAKKLKRFMKGDKVLPILGYAQVHKDGVFATNLDASIKLYAKPVEGQYPDYQKLIPKENRKAQITLDPKLLNRALEVFGSDHSITIDIGEALEPVVMRNNDSLTKKMVIVMPLKK